MLLQVRSICEEMTMDGCERCMPSWQAGKKWADCDLLDTYSWLCYQMPGGWKAMPTLALTGLLCRVVVEAAVLCRVFVRVLGFQTYGLPSR